MTVIEQEWNERYSESHRIWSGQPNGALVAEVGDLEPGRVLDVGCGEGADAVWLAKRGWQVTALDVSSVALGRARQHADEAGVEITWVHSGLVEASLPAGSFDLVSAQYPALFSSTEQVAERELLSLVAPGGTLLFVHHVVIMNHAHDHPRNVGFNPEDYVSPADMAAALDDSWVVEVDEQRPRHVTTGSGAGHTHDIVLRARRA